MISLKDITFRRGDRQILNGINLHMNKGEHWVILGRNGCGKTTLLEMMTGYEFPSSGTVDVLGNRYGECDVREVRKQIGYISQSVMEKLTLSDPVWEVVATGEYAFLRFYQEIEEAVRLKSLSLLDEVGLLHTAEQPLGSLSQGERKKVMLARALMLEPKLLIMDEPCAGLDLYEREKLLIDLGRLSQRDMTVVYVTHHMEEIIPLFTHVALVQNGEIMAAGPKKQVLSAEWLSTAYDWPVEVHWADDRPWIRARSGGKNVVTEWIGTANHGFASLAMEELRRMIQGIKFIQLVAGEVFRIEVPLSREAMLDIVQTNEPIFLRHIQPIDRILPIQGNADDLHELSELVRHARMRCENGTTAIHLRRIEGTRFPYSAADTKAVLDAVIMELGAETTMQSPEQILSIYAGLEELYVGWGTPAEQLSDWPGGAIRFQREEDQISRAKFKLLEAERAFKLYLENFREALDIGAAPGGWTQLLLERGLRVTSIDPAELHPKLAAYPRLTVFKKNASDVHFAPDTFDLLVCDMSWSPMQMAKLVLEKTEALKQGASAVITVKLMHKKPLQTIRDVIAKLESAFELRKAKQLFHNRDEITLYLVKK